MKSNLQGILLLGVIILLVACQADKKTAPPKPQLPTAEAVGYFCNMLVNEHKGPKSQIHLSGKSEPLWFTTVRDGIAYTKLPEESQGVAMLYVTAIDTMTEFNLAHPEMSPDAWIQADWALYVIDSNLRGGMGAMEAFPFREGAQANQFVEMHGGRIVRLSDIPEGYVLGNSETLPETEQPGK
ncbi:MAG: nitrous oxide reductase accessory protein NosL [Pseudomonadales bacterium]|nr:nitrous oxide reductase accessory protein NosL [Pseudomonadales bacterium]MCP5214757.1 nitrous oxide reductase accessory protein NosL [Pseudomonadales bacterium]